MIKHKKPVFYNSRSKGLHVVHSFQGDKVIVGGSCSYYSDALTNIERFEVPLSIVNTEWIRIYKRRIDSYPFLTKSNDCYRVENDGKFNWEDELPMVRILSPVERGAWEKEKVQDTRRGRRNRTHSTR